MIYFKCSNVHSDGELYPADCGNSLKFSSLHKTSNVCLLNCRNQIKVNMNSTHLKYTFKFAARHFANTSNMLKKVLCSDEIKTQLLASC